VPRGRPSKLTPELTQQFCDALRRCWHIETAADMTGISRRSVYSWIKKGKQEGEGVHRDFLHAVKKALAETAAQCVGEIQAAGKSSWQANAWLLERRYPELWSSVVNDVRELQRWRKEQEGKQREQNADPKPAP